MIVESGSEHDDDVPDSPDWIQKFSTNYSSLALFIVDFGNEHEDDGFDGSNWIPEL